MSLTDSFYSGVAPDRELANILDGPAADIDALGGLTHLDVNISVSATMYTFDVDVIVVVGGNLFAGAWEIGAWDY